MGGSVTALDIQVLNNVPERIEIAQGSRMEYNLTIANIGTEEATCRMVPKSADVDFVSFGDSVVLKNSNSISSSIETISLVVQPASNTRAKRYTMDYALICGNITQDYSSEIRVKPKSFPISKFFTDNAVFYSGFAAFILLGSVLVIRRKK